jgi:hypothetical protein
MIPKHSIGNLVYLRESAAYGFLEPVVISSVSNNNGRWLYTIRTGATQSLGDKRSMINSAVMYFGEDELISHCEALQLAEAKARSVLSGLERQRELHCPQAEEPSTEPTEPTEE